MLTIDIWQRRETAQRLIEIRDRSLDAVRIVESIFEVSSMEPYTGTHYIGIDTQHQDIKELFEYLRQTGRVVIISCEVAKQTIQYLKETN